MKPAALYKQRALLILSLWPPNFTMASMPVLATLSTIGPRDRERAVEAPVGTSYGLFMRGQCKSGQAREYIENAGGINPIRGQLLSCRAGDIEMSRPVDAHRTCGRHRRLKLMHFLHTLSLFPLS